MQVVAKRPRIVVFGDSITQHGSSSSGGWVAALQEYYMRKADIINRGYSGYNTRFAKFLAPQILAEHGDPPLLMTFFFGANDAALPDRVGYRQHVALSEYQSNLRDMVELSRRQGVRHMVLITPPPVHDAGRVQHQASVAVVVPHGLDVTLPDRTNEQTRQYADTVGALAQELQLPCVNLHTLMQEQSGWESKYLVPDGLHLSPDGNKFVYDQLTSTVAKNYPHLRPEELPWHFPPWASINLTDPTATFRDVSAGRLINSPPAFPDPAVLLPRPRDPGAAQAVEQQQQQQQQQQQ